MRTTLSQPIGPESTPTAIRWLILITSISSVSLSLVDGILQAMGNGIDLQRFVSLTPQAVYQGLIWQPITYFFIQSVAPGLSFFLAIQLLFYMYILWVIGTLVYERVGCKPFLRLYFSCGILAGLFALAAMVVTGQYQVIAGSAAPIYGLLLVWAMLQPDQEILIFFVIQAKARWIVACLLGLQLLIDLSHVNMVGIAHTLAAFGTAYLYGVIAWSLSAPFTVFHPLDSQLAKLSSTLQKRWAARHFEAPQRGSNSKIWTLKSSGSEVDDEEFLDLMLTKISDQGEQALSKKEKRRLDAISKRKSR